MVCPHCNVPLQMTDRDGIEIDYCPQCRGVWLDRGELDKIIERSLTRVAPGRGYVDYDDDDDHHRHDYHRRHKKSFLKDLFDF